MTGEITLSGRVLPIGGVKEKILGAVRAASPTSCCPRRTSRISRICTKEVRKKIHVELVENLGQVLAFTLRDASLKNGRLVFRDDASHAIDVTGPPH